MMAPLRAGIPPAPWRGPGCDAVLTVGIEAALREHLVIELAFVGVPLAQGHLLRCLFEGGRRSRCRVGNGTGAGDLLGSGDVWPFQPAQSHDRAG